MERTQQRNAAMARGTTPTSQSQAATIRQTDFGQLSSRRITNQNQKGQGRPGLAFILKHGVGNDRLPRYGGPGSLVAPPDAIGVLTESI